ncbi:hypothetical protein ElyMa_002595900 [Elysia marginata]|uniref:Uncharacterized protein n=1 Tax=Elysia marginata TaxID=1093978 RepID=A0AAV4H4J1_9GAST|nr:hypothetical protein ElyMa_002595900 [Elysia marginata]
MDDFWGVTILLFIVLTLFVVVILKAMAYCNKYSYVRHEKVRMLDRYATLKSGDIILFIRHTHGFTNSLFTNDLYSHGGMVVEVDGELFISEATVDSLPNTTTGEEEALPSSSQINPLLHRLRNYPGALFLMPLKYPLTPKQEKILRDRVLVETPYPSAVHMLKAMFRIPVCAQARHCMQHLAWLLDEVGLTPTRYVERGDKMLELGFLVSSRGVTTLSDEPLGPEGLNVYGPVYELLFDMPPPKEAWAAAAAESV